MWKVLILLMILCQFTEYGAARHHRTRFSNRRHSFRRQDELPETGEPQEGTGGEHSGSYEYVPSDQVEEHSESFEYVPSDDVEPAPEEGKRTAEQDEPAPEEGKPAPEEGEPAPEEGGPAPEEGGPAPEEGGPPPGEGEPPPGEGGPPPGEGEPPPGEGGPPPGEEGPPPGEGTPPPGEAGPPVGEEGPPPGEGGTPPGEGGPPPGEQEPPPDEGGPPPEEGGPPNEQEGTNFATNHGLTVYPFIVTIEFNEEDICAGVIFSDHHVITPASCVCDWKHRRETANLGVETITEKPNTQKYPVKKTLCHPEFTENFDYSHDIGIVSIETPFKFNELVSQYPIDFENPYTLTEQPEFVLVEINWQQNKTRRQEENEIHTENVLLHSTHRRVCDFARHTYKNHGHDKARLKETEFCVIEEQGTCNAIEGSSVMSEKKLVGLITRRMCNSGLKGVYSFVNLPEHFEWIQTEMKKKSRRRKRKRLHKN